MKNEIILTSMNTVSEKAITESAALRLLDWPSSRRGELRGMLPSVPTGSSLLYEKSAVEALAKRGPGTHRETPALFTR